MDPISISELPAHTVPDLLRADTDDYLPGVAVMNPSPVEGKVLRMYGVFVPETAQRMFANETPDKTWWIRHYPSGGRLLHVDTLAEALEYAKTFHDIGVSAGLPMDTTDMKDLTGWVPAILAANFLFVHERDNKAAANG